MNLLYTDILTYVAIRSFNNPEYKACFPAYETIAERMRASRGFVIKSIERLVNSKIVHVVKSTVKHKSNKYYFPEIEKSEKIPYELFDYDLSIYEKSMLLVLKQFCEATPICILKSIKQIAKEIGVSYKTIYTQVKSLIEKGYILDKSRSYNTGKVYYYYQLTDKIDWWDKYNSPKVVNPEQPTLIIV